MVPRANVVTAFPGATRFCVPVTTPRSIRSMKPSEMSSVWTPRFRWSRSPASSALGIEPMPAWMVAPSGIRSATCAAIRWSTTDGADGGTSTRGRSTSTHPSTWLTWSWLPPKVRGICSFTSRKNGARPMKGAT